MFDLMENREKVERNFLQGDGESGKLLFQLSSKESLGL